MVNLSTIIIEPHSFERSRKWELSSLRLVCFSPTFPSFAPHTIANGGARPELTYVRRERAQHHSPLPSQHAGGLLCVGGALCGDKRTILYDKVPD